MTLRAIIMKEWIQTFRDKRMLLIIFAVPVLQMILFGVATDNEVRNLRTVIVDQDRSGLSREIFSAVSRGDYFHVTEITGDVNYGVSALMQNRARIVIVIPPGLEGHFRSADAKAQVQLMLDGSDGNSATIAMGYLLRILNSTAEKAMPAAVSGLRPSVHPLHIETRVLYNQALVSSHYMVPGIIAMILTVITTMLTAMGITREKERGTFEQLVVSPIRGWELMLGKTIPYAVIAAVDAAIATAIGMLIFQIPLAGSLSALVVLNLAYILAMLGMGLFISTISQTQQQAMMTVFAVLFPFIILSDFFFPLENMPQAVQYGTLLNPMRYALRAQREIFLKGSGWEQVWPNILLLTGFAVAFLSYGSLRFRKSLQA